MTTVFLSGQKKRLEFRRDQTWCLAVFGHDKRPRRDINLWKYVDDSTLSEVIDKRCTSSMQDYVNEFALKSTTNGMQLK